MKFIISLLTPFIAAAIGSAFTFSEITTWYEAINKPTWTPPNAIFGPVWTILYTLMGISLYLFWKSEKKVEVSKRGFILFFSQLALNTVWSILFFGLKNPLLALADIAVLWVLILMTILHFRKVNKLSAYLLIPYLLWVTFASLLNFAVWMLN